MKLYFKKMDLALLWRQAKEDYINSDCIEGMREGWDLEAIFKAKS